MLLLCMMALPIKMVLRWLFNLKYIVAMPEIFSRILKPYASSSAQGALEHRSAEDIARPLEPLRNETSARQQQGVRHLAQGGRAANAGIGTRVGRASTRPSVRVNSAFVTGIRETPRSPGRRAPGVTSACRIAPTASSSATQLHHCRPDPTTPPTPRRKGKSILASAPPAGLRTIPNRR